VSSCTKKIAYPNVNRTTFHSETSARKENLTDREYSHKATCNSTRHTKMTTTEDSI
jgi:hypothetical protein